MSSYQVGKVVTVYRYKRRSSINPHGIRDSLKRMAISVAIGFTLVMLIATMAGV